MEIRNVLERLKLLTNDDREDLLLMLSGDAVQRLKARLCCTKEEENAHEEALCAAAAAQAAYQFWLLEEAASPKSLSAGESLWDYAYFTGVSIDRLAENNRHIACIAALKDGEEVHVP